MRNKTWTILAASSLLLAGVQSVRLAYAQDAAAAQAEDAEAEKKRLEAEKKLLEVGKVAPDFTLPLVGGGEATLGNLLKTHKAVIVVFWGAEAENGGRDLPKLQKLHEELEPKGVTTVGVNPVEDMSDTERFVRRRMLGFQVCIDGKETNRAVTHVYKAKTLPTYYLLDPAAKVLWRGIGYQEAALREAVAKAGIK